MRPITHCTLHAPRNSCRYVITQCSLIIIVTKEIILLYRIWFKNSRMPQRVWTSLHQTSNDYAELECALGLNENCTWNQTYNNVKIFLKLLFFMYNNYYY